MADTELTIVARLKDMVTDQLKSMNAEMHKLSKNAKSVSSSASMMLTPIGKIAGALGAALAAGTTIQKVITLYKESGVEYAKQVQAEAKLAGALGHRSKMLVELANKMQTITTYADDDLIIAESQLANFISQEEVIGRLLPLVADFASAMQMDVASAADLVTKTLASSTNALTRYGIQVEGAVGSQERLESLTKSLGTAFKGQAEALAKTDVGKLQQMKNISGDLKEQLGDISIALQIIKERQTIGILQGLVEWKNNLQDILEKLHLIDKQSESTDDTTLRNLETLRKKWQSIKDEQLTAQQQASGPAAGFSLVGQMFNPEQLKKAEEVIARIDKKIAEINSKNKKDAGPGYLKGGESSAQNILEQLAAVESLSKNSFARMRTFRRQLAAAQESDYQFGALAGQREQAKTELEWALEVETEMNLKRAESYSALYNSIVENAKWAKDQQIAMAVIAAEEEARQRSLMLDTMQNYMQQFGTMLMLVGEASRANAEQMKKIRIASILMDGASASMGNWRAAMQLSYPANIIAGVAGEALITGITAAQVAIASRQQFAMGTPSAPGGYAMVGEEGPEMMYVPAGARVKTARETARMNFQPSFVLNFNGPVDHSTLPGIRNDLAALGKNFERAVRTGNIDLKRLMSYPQ